MTLLDDLVLGLRESSCVVDGPFDADAARAHVVARVRALGPAAATRDDALEAVGVVDALRASGASVVVPGDENWASRLPHVAVGVTGAALGVAQPAALVLASAPGAPRAASLLPPVHLCVLRAADVVASLDDALTAFRGRLPSGLTFVGGPSRTGDLEMILTLGVHGPRVVEVVLTTGG